ncbi:hypothetical protein EDC96DRAFT_545524 [Choanephora cucurbitarum]|nr:hypothetical protein EDC96DRAFT_545524 [Choanephora cucurbitarum]
MTGLGPNDGSVYQVSDGKKTQVGQRNTRHLINMPTILTELCLSSSSRFATLHLCHAHLHVVLHLLQHSHINAIVISGKLFYSSKYDMIKLCCQKDSIKTIAYLFICSFELLSVPCTI